MVCGRLVGRGHAQTSKVLVAFDDRITEYPKGDDTMPDIIRPIPREGLDGFRNFVAVGSGDLWIYDGASTPTLSLYSPSDPTMPWRHYAEGQFSGVGRSHHGGIGVYGDYVFVTDDRTDRTYRVGLQGRLMRFNRRTEEVIHFGQGVTDPTGLCVGLDGLLYAIGWNDHAIHVFDPRSLAKLRDVTLVVAGDQQVSGITVLADGSIVGAVEGSWVKKWTAAGKEVASIRLTADLGRSVGLGNIVVLPDGSYAVGNRGGSIFLVARDLSSFSYVRFQDRTGVTRVASKEPMLGPVVVSDLPAVGVERDQKFFRSFKEFFRQQIYGAAMSYSISGLPKGFFHFDEEECTLWGWAEEEGSWTVTVTAKEDGVVPKLVRASFVMTVGTPPTALVSIAARAHSGTGNNVAIGGFAISGPAPRRVLIRAVGYSLAFQGLPSNEVMADPVVEVYRGQALIASNDDFVDTSAEDAVSYHGAVVGAFKIPPIDKKSAALVLTLEPGAYSFVAKGASDTTGIVLLEVYDAEPGTPGARFEGIATRARAGLRDRVAIGGFVVRGDQPKRVLVRASGKSLAAQGLNLGELLQDPVLELHGSAGMLAGNDDWASDENAAEITSVSARLGVAPFAETDTTSSALLITLNPGVYSFIVRGKNEGVGIVLLEVYDAD